MSGRYTVRTTPQFDRLARRLTDQHPAEFPPLYSQALRILRADPYNLTREHQIAKLTEVPHGEGQYRLRLRRFRFRYDIEARTVILVYCGLRREDTYR